MQFDFRQDLSRYIIKCKNRDIFITYKITLNVITNNVKKGGKYAVNACYNEFRYFSFGFLIKVGSCFASIPAYYVHNLVNLVSFFTDEIVIGKIIMYWDVSNAVNITCLFRWNKNRFNISVLANWDVSNVKCMDSMFWNSNAVGDIAALSNWNVGKVTNMQFMFCCCQLDGDIVALSNWDVSNVKNMEYMFCNTRTKSNYSAKIEYDNTKSSNGGIFGNISALNNWKVNVDANIYWMFNCSDIVIDSYGTDKWYEKEVKRIL